ncbi:MAG: DUF5009 domain-containing protein [Bacteroidota bacterium]
MNTTRLVSLDLFRGLIMFLLVAEGCRLYGTFSDLTEASFLHGFAEQFHHHPWDGLRFWDLVQPYFMFIVGVAMWYSVQSRQKKGQSRGKITRHILQRSAILLLFGISLHIGYRQQLTLELWNVLSQLSITIPIAYFIMRLPNRVQIAISIGLLILTEFLYRYTGIDGYDQPFVKDQNFGSYVDMLLMGKLNDGGGWVTFNAIPTAAHTIWGVLAGKLLASETKPNEKVKWLLIFGAIGLVIGYGLHFTGVTPIIKRICTSAFVLVSGGWCLLTLALFYWWVDIRKTGKWPWFFAVVGMNSIFIYLFMETVGSQWMVDFVGYFTMGLGSLLGLATSWNALLNSLFSLGIAWGLCYWLYKKQLFFKI